MRDHKVTVDVMIPVYKPGDELDELLHRLREQSVPVREILIINTDRRYWREDLVRGLDGVRVIHVGRQEFDHGGTRRMGSQLCDGEFFIWMTQDAMPKDRYLVEELLKPFADEKVAASYARQLPKEDCGFLEGYARVFNYPPKSCVKSEQDEAVLGIKAFFLSDVCAAYRRRSYEQVGGFVKKTIFNEDMIFAIQALRQGFSVAYQAEAQVFHSHNYTVMQLFSRNFDLGVSQREYAALFEGIRSESEGVRMVKDTAWYLVRRRRAHLVLKLFMDSIAKFAGYRLGKRYHLLPKWLILRCTSMPYYWT